MRLVLHLFALLVAVSATAATLIVRQSNPTLPSCAIPCLGYTNLTSCSPDDDSCLCTNQAFINASTTCIESSCSGQDLSNAEAFAQQLCIAVGVTLTASSAAPTASPSASASASASSSSGASVTSTVSVLACAIAALAFGASL